MLMRGANWRRKYKIQNYQNGHAYLTSHRVCYVATEDPRKYSVAIDLKEIDRVEYQVRDKLYSSFDSSIADIFLMSRLAS
jgi:hypothetical protein